MELYLSPEEVAHLLRVSDQTIINLCKAGELGYTKVGRQYRIPQKAVEDYTGRAIKLVLDDKGDNP